ncbi:helix-turn-helix transcriptional regulator [Rhizobium terrae]|uniref:helix-turn-helix transcriptional regulator n=1 Tax=Rhizobium terrae TaxID=2171756 RepID=UPI000E3CCF12|nr:LuxR C-terminal-related transcriptional regulator [Rhizobium terrae]
MKSALQDELIDLIYGTVFSDRGWQPFLDRLNASMSFGKTSLLLHDASTRAGAFPISSGYDLHEITAYAQYFASINPWMPKAAIRRVGVGITSDDMYHPRELQKTEFYNDYLKASGLAGGAGVTIAREKGRSFILTSLMSERDLHRSKEYAALMTTLAPHLRRAFDYQQKQYRDGLQSQARNRLLDIAGVGLLVCGGNAKVITMNETASLLLNQSCGIRVSATGKICVFDESLQHMLEHNRAPTTQASYDVLFEKNGRAFRITALWLNSSDIFEFLHGPSVALVVKPVMADLAEGAFGLSAAEAEVATAVIDGMSLSEIADSRQVSKETVRTQLKVVFRKLGISGQLELVRRFGSKASS